ncbi:hypothetical protein R3W88_000860 [Solanum pinnatisectum]|uniref:Uncharacterized protein n=1 Tax=Solanum pinnatisectum TaxID=50273 RepID=A0AAV9MH41_9SOLN|nr:hypothetical protein R3W88_000860 [Solanum pinnatisectum]
MFEEKDKVEEVSSLRQSLDNMKKEIRALCKRAQDLEVLLTATEDELRESIITFQGIGSGLRIYLVGANRYWARPKFMMPFMHLYSLMTVTQTFYKHYVKFPKTNTFLTSAGELSIYLWYLHILGGLPIWGSLYEEIVHKAKELVCFDEKRTKYIHRTCEYYLFAAFHHLRGVNQELSFIKWINLMKPPPVTQVERGLPNVSCDEVKDDLGYEAHKHPSPTMSTFDRKKVILDAQKDFISSLWNVIKGKLSRSDVDSASPLKDEIQVIIKEMDCKYGMLHL